jgi:N-sulfoglucosamine sulfohydrolase
MMELAGIAKPPSLPGRSLMPATRGKSMAEERRYLFSACDGGTSIFFHPTRGVRNARYKLIRNLQPGRENPDYGLYSSHFNEHFAGGTEIPEIEAAVPDVRKAYALWRHPPEYELYDLQKDPHEMHDLAEDPGMRKVLNELKKALADWQADSRDPLADSALLAEYIREMEDVNTRYPKHAYNKDSSFRWKFPAKFREYVYADRQAGK